MLRKGIAVIIRNIEERECFVKACEKAGFLGTAGSSPADLCSRLPVKIYIDNRRNNNNRCMSYSNVNYTNSDNEYDQVIEASILFKNQLISMKHNAKKASKI